MAKQRKGNNWFGAVLGLALGGIALLNVATVVLADELDDINDEKDDKQTEKNQQQNHLGGVNYAIGTTSSNLSAVSAQIAAIESQMQTLQQEKATLEAEIVVLDAEITAAADEYAQGYEEYTNSVVELYKLTSDHQNEVMYVFAEFEDVENVVYFSSVQGSLLDNLLKLEEKLLSYQEKQRKLDEDKATLVANESEMLLLQEDLEIQKAQYQSLLAAQKAEKSRVLAEISELDQEIAALDEEARRIIAAKYPSTPSSGGGSNTKPVGSTTGYYKVTVQNSAGSVISEKYLEGPIRVSAQNYMSVNGSYLYQGVLEVRDNTNVYLINDIPMEKYLLGLGEMPSSWGMNGGSEALKAQAVIGRAYAVANLGKRAGYYYDLVDSTDDQNYVGYWKAIENSGGVDYGQYWSQAVTSTSGKVVTLNGAFVATYYSSSAAGHTLSTQEVWGGYRAHCIGVSDWTDPASGTSYDSVAGSPYTYWNAGGSTGTVTDSILVNIINYAIDTYGLGSHIDQKVGTITGLQYVYNTGSSTITTDTKRTTSLIITGTAGTWTMNADYFRIAYNVVAPGKLALWSKLWDVQKEGNIYRFYSRGFGHRVGLSQYGAYGMSKSGYNYSQIITHYYTGTAVVDYNTNFNIRIGLTKIPSVFYIIPSGSGSITAGGSYGGGVAISLSGGEKVSIVEVQ